MSAYRPLVDSGRGAPSYSTEPIPWLLETLHAESKVGILDRLEPNECLSQYALTVQSNRRNLLVVASDDNFAPAAQNKFITGSHVYWGSPFLANDATNGEDASNAYNWMCSAMNLEGVCSNNVDRARQNTSSWRVGYDCDDMELCQLGTFPVQYCLAQPAEPHCRLQFDTTIAIIVTALNFGKLPCFHTCCDSTCQNASLLARKRRIHIWHTSLNWIDDSILIDCNHQLSKLQPKPF
jgi:hypothetical protein